MNNECTLQLIMFFKINIVTCLKYSKNRIYFKNFIKKKNMEILLLLEQFKVNQKHLYWAMQISSYIFSHYVSFVFNFLKGWYSDDNMKNFSIELSDKKDTTYFVSLLQCLIAAIWKWLMFLFFFLLKRWEWTSLLYFLSEQDGKKWSKN